MSMFYYTPDLNLPYGSDPEADVDSLVDFIDWASDLLMAEQSGLDPNWVSDVEQSGLDPNWVGEYEALFAELGGANENIVLPSASEAVVENLDSVAITQQDVDDDNVICAVCMDDMNLGEIAKQLPCFHRYHGDCIVPWLVMRNTCPICRYQLPTDHL